MKTRYITIIILFLLTLLLIQFRRNTINRKLEPTTLKDILKSELIDVKGRKLSHHRLEGKVIYIQFVDPLDSTDVSLINNIYLEWKNKELAFIVITNDLASLINNSIIDVYDTKDVIVIENEFEKLKKQFNSPLNIGTNYLVDNSGNVILSGINKWGYYFKLEASLNRLLKDEISISKVLITGSKIDEIDWFEQLKNIIDKGNEYEFYIISIFTNICITCQSGIFLNKLKKLHEINKNNIYFISIVDQSFNDIDIENMKNNLGIKYQIIRADRRLSDKWNNLKKNYQEKYLDFVIFVLNKEKTVVKILDRNNNNEKEFFNFLHKLVE